MQDLLGFASALFIDMVFHRKTVTELTCPGTVSILRRPDYKPRWRFPFRRLRSVSLWTIFVLLVSSNWVRCMHESGPASVIVDCAQGQSDVAGMQVLEWLRR